MKIIISILFLSFILFTSCNAYKDVQEPEYREIRDVRLIKASILQTTAGMNVIYYNPNNFSLQLSDARGDVYVDNAFLGRFDLDEKVQVRKNSEFVLPISFNLDNINIINQRDIYKKKEALVRIEGIAHIKKSGFSKEIPVKYESIQNIERFKSLVGQ